MPKKGFTGPRKPLRRRPGSALKSRRVKAEGLAAPTSAEDAPPGVSGPPKASLRRTPAARTRKALRRLRTLETGAETGTVRLTAWESAFISGVSERLETYGSAFRDPAKGRPEEALSDRQGAVVRALSAKARVAARKGAGPRQGGSPLRRGKEGQPPDDGED